MNRTIVIVPTYNERDNVERLLPAILGEAPELHLLVVDDSSPDGTADAVRVLQLSHDRIRLLVRPTKAGLGTAYVTAFKYALGEGFDRVVTMDGDFSHDPSYLPEMLRRLDRHDVVIGSRYVPGGGTLNWGLDRRLLSGCGNLYARLVLGVPIRDCSAGYVGYRRRVLDAIPLDAVHSEGYSFLMEMKYWAYHLGFDLGEMPIVFAERSRGRSKISRAILIEALWVVWRLRRTVPTTAAGMRGSV
ncbi:MAG: polyprenol monophosphomannose synthase [Candidatus Eisenbacteria bacterium]|jgi:dolichol-phosphate mannosyltransferase|nr:polyprenol monophosphomannose synthase [Candidatus Eisenbacteria bacterium]